MSSEDSRETVRISIMGRQYNVPRNVTIQSALEEAGYLLKRGSGCRGGFCGGCATLYRKEGEYELHADLACQKVVEEGMRIVQIPYTPTPRTNYDINSEGEEEISEAVLQQYPSTARCISCNRCTDICPQDLDVMEFVNAAIRGDIEEVVEESFDCIMCGLCALRCPSEIPQPDMALFARRLQGKYGEPTYDFLKERIEEIEEGEFEEELEELKSMSKDELREAYESREMEV